jgi:hypothetical protein
LCGPCRAGQRPERQNSRADQTYKLQSHRWLRVRRQA